MIDVDDIVEDPDFAQAMTIYRRQYDAPLGIINPKPWGSIQSGANKDLIRGSDFSSTDKLITVYSRFRFLPEGATFNLNSAPIGTAITDAFGNQILPTGYARFKADIVFWHGDPYEVFSIQDWSDYGQGYTAVVCNKITMGETGLPQDGDYTNIPQIPAMNFTLSQNSSYVPVT
jgi:hypothetical protein